jgi:hypothetical protein
MHPQKVDFFHSFSFVEKVVSKSRHSVVRPGRAGNGDLSHVDLGDPGTDQTNLFLVTTPSPASIQSARSIDRHRTGGYPGSEHLRRFILSSKDDRSSILMW